MTPGAEATAPATTMRRVRHFASRFRYYWRELTGEATYDRYVAHARSCSPGAEVMTRREFERSRTDAQEADPREGFRCC